MSIRWLFLLPLAGFSLAASNQPKSEPPLGYFANKCQRCHGEAGANFDAAMGKGKTDAWLVQEVKEMAEGPGQSPLEGEALNAQVAFHRALIAKEPFLYVSKFANDLLTGECTPGSQVVAIVGLKRFPAKVDSTTWQVKLPAKTAAKSISIEAKIEDRITKLALAKAWYSHQAPFTSR